MSAREQIAGALAAAAYAKGRTTGPDWDGLDDTWLRDHYRQMGEYYADALAAAGLLPTPIGSLVLAKQGKHLRIVRELSGAAGAERLRAECQEHAAANPEWYGKFEYLIGEVSLGATTCRLAAEGPAHPEGSSGMPSAEPQDVPPSDGGGQQ